MIDLAQRLANLTPTQRKLLERKLKEKPHIGQPIAIVGLACRLPGAPNLEAFWNLISMGESAICEVPSDRWDVDEYYDENPDTPGKMATRHMGAVADIAEFDAPFFGISPREATRMDPQQRLLLEVTWEALEHAGISPDLLAGTATGVFVGIGANDYSKLSARHEQYFETIDPHVGTGNALSIAANRLSYILDFRGPSVAVDTACSSSSVGLHMAVQSLRGGETNTAIAGGVNLILTPDISVAFSKARMLSPTGQCRPFDAEANGYVRGEGCVMLVLKRLTDAVDDGDNVLAVIRGTAVNQDGRTSGITAPNSLSQESCIRSALANAGLSAKDVNYVEAHGTGTPLGDPIEFQSLCRLFSQDSGEDRPVYVSSVKANVGHTETVSGMTGLAKVVLMFQHGVIPAQAGLAELNSNIHLDGTRLRIPREAVDWNGDEAPQVAGISSFGFGGTNSHLIVQAAGKPSPPTNRQDRPLHICTVSAKSKKGLTAIAQRYADSLQQNEAMELADFCHTAHTGRMHFNHRLTALATSRDQLIEQLTKFSGDKRAKDLKSGEVTIAVRPKVAFMFTGQGSQYVNMGRTLYQQHPEFRKTIDRCHDILRECRNESLTSVLYPQDESESPLNDTAWTQPALFAIEYALAELWRSWGIEPSVLVGHSVGEYVAACVAGVFSLEDGLLLIAERARLMQEVKRHGKMTAILAGREQVEAAVAPLGGSVCVATANGPENNVISGEAESVDQLVAQFDAAGIPTRPLTVSHAFHSPLMDEMLDDFEDFAATLTYSRPRIPIVANRTGNVAEDGSLNAQYWRDHLRNCVEFARSMETLAGMDVHAFLEVGPAPHLAGMGRRCIPDHDAAWISSLRQGKDEWNTMLAAAAELYRLGFKLDWRQFEAPWSRTRSVLPSYPFQRTRQWLVDGRKRIQEVSGSGGPKVHSLLGSEVTSALDSTIYRGRLSSRSPKYLGDHQVQGSVVVPAAAYLEQGLAAAHLAFGNGDHGVESLAIQQAMFLPVEGARDTEVVVAPESGGRATFETYSIDSDNSNPKAPWSMHVSGTLVHEEVCPADNRVDEINLDELRGRLDREVTAEQSYQLMAERGLEYGKAFQGLGNLRRGERESLAEIDLDDSVIKELDKYHLHPALGDALLQSIAGTAAPEQEAAGAIFLPVGVQRVQVHREFADGMLAYAIRTTELSDSPDQIEADVRLLDTKGRVLAELLRVVLQRVGRAADGEQSENISDWMYRVDWQSQPLPENAEAKLGGAYLVFGEDNEMGRSLSDAIQAAGGRSILVKAGDQFARHDDDSFTVRPTERDDYGKLLDEAFAGDNAECAAVVHAWGLHGISLDSGNDALGEIRRRGVGSALPLIQQLARFGFKQPPSIWLATRQGQAISERETTNPVNSPVWGLGRVAALEHPELRCRLIDFAADQPTQTIARQLVVEIGTNPDEDQIAHRNGDRFVARLVSDPDRWTSAAADGGLTVPGDGPYQLRITRAGSMDSLNYVPFKLIEPGEGQIQVEVRAAGLNFSDVLKAMGLYPGIKDAIVPLGIECSGVVTAVGSGVDRFRVGDKVIGVAPYSFGSHTVTADYAMVHKPENLTDAEASTIPITFLTAYYALVRLAQLQRGEKVLIHAGAGGVGLAAIQIAKHLGAEIFATAGSDEKREHLRQLGVHHVMNSRTLDFADEIMEITNRQGVDVVLNSLPGPTISKSLSCLTAYGRFLEIGKIDIYKNTMIGLLPFQDNLSYFAIDLDRMLRQRPDYIREMFAELMNFFTDGTYQPLPLTQFSIEQTIESFRYMAGRKNIGKVVVSIAGKSDGSADERESDTLAQVEGTYLITGGLGALGLQVGQWLADQGAGHVALMGRREPSELAKATMTTIEDSGTRVVALQGDVADRDSLTQALASIPKSFPPLRGVIHAAGVLADGVMFDMSTEQLEKPLTPKIDGTWYLHEATKDQPLEFFVMFSSVASVLGSPGQANYAAGNLFLDSVAAWRRAQGLPAVSVNWGPWADSGMAAEAGRDQQLEGRGMRLLPSDKAFEILRLILKNPQGQPTVMSVRWQDMLKAGGGSVPPLLRVVAPAASGEAADSVEDKAFRAMLSGQDVEERKKTLNTFFANEMGNITGMDPADIDITQPLSNMGLDSLLAIELKNKIEGHLKIVLPMALFMQEPSINTLVEHVAEAYDQTRTGQNDDVKEPQSNSDLSLRPPRNSLPITPSG